MNPSLAHEQIIIQKKKNRQPENRPVAKIKLLNLHYLTTKKDDGNWKLAICDDSS